MSQVKTKEQIQRENLRKTLTRLKVRVADMESLWLEFFQDAISAFLTARIEDDGKKGEEAIEAVTHDARLLADSALNEYEDRWGKG